MNPRRLPPLTPDVLNEQQKKLYGGIVDGPRGAKFSSLLVGADGSLQGPFNALLYSPAVGTHIEQLGAAVRFDTALRPDIRELAILVTAFRTHCEFEWNSHIPIAEESGLDREALEALHEGNVVVFDDEQLQVVLELGNEIFDSYSISSNLFEKAVEAVGFVGIVELISIFGYYSLLAMVLNGFEI
jgi:4-carboxymuconolactone decarboxylase